MANIVFFFVSASQLSIFLEVFAGLLHNSLEPDHLVFSGIISKGSRKASSGGQRERPYSGRSNTEVPA